MTNLGRAFVAAILLTGIAVAVTSCANSANATLLACNTYASTLYSLSTVKLTASQVEQINTARAIANPICESPTIVNTPTNVATLQKAIDQLAAAKAAQVGKGGS